MVKVEYELYSFKEKHPEEYQKKSREIVLGLEEGYGIELFYDVGNSNYQLFYNKNKYKTNYSAIGCYSHRIYISLCISSLVTLKPPQRDIVQIIKRNENEYKKLCLSEWYEDENKHIASYEATKTTEATETNIIQRIISMDVDTSEEITSCIEYLRTLVKSFNQNLFAQMIQKWGDMTLKSIFTK